MLPAGVGAKNACNPVNSWRATIASRCPGKLGSVLMRAGAHAADRCGCCWTSHGARWGLMGGVGESGDAGLVEVRPRISTDATAYGGLLERNCGLEGEEPQRAALRSFGSCDAVWRGGHLWSVFGMLGENLLSSTRGLWSSQLRGSMDRQGWSGAGPVRQDKSILWRLRWWRNQWMPLGCSLRAGALSSKEDLDGATGSSSCRVTTNGCRWDLGGRVLAKKILAVPRVRLCGARVTNFAQLRKWPHGSGRGNGSRTLGVAAW